MVRAAIRGGTPVASTSSVARSTVAIGEAGKIHCTASLLSSSIAVTAAHCLNQRGRIDIRFREGYELILGSVRLPIVAWRVHPDRTAGGSSPAGEGDIAVVRFVGALPEGYGPASILPKERKLTPGTLVRLAGYGRTEESALDKAGPGLREVTVPVLRARPGSYEIHLEQRGGAGACKGDSGGPGFLEQNGQLYLWGVTNRMIEWEDGIDYLCQRTAVYADLRAVSDWLTSAIAELGAEAR